MCVGLHMHVISKSATGEGPSAFSHLPTSALRPQGLEGLRFFATSCSTPLSSAAYNGSALGSCLSDPSPFLCPHPAIRMMGACHTWCMTHFLGRRAAWDLPAHHVDNQSRHGKLKESRETGAVPAPLFQSLPWKAATELCVNSVKEMVHHCDVCEPELKPNPE